jgi:hypothetical protein
LQEYNSCLDYFSEAEDTPSIVSVRIKNFKGERPFLNKAELTPIFKSMTLDLSDSVNGLDKDIISRKCFMG